MTGEIASAPARRALALTWMPVQLVLLFVTLAAIDLACQSGGSLLVRFSPASLRDALRLVSALALSAAMIGAYRGLVNRIERRSPHELAASGAARGLSLGLASGVGLFGLVYAVLGALGAVTLHGYGTASGLAAAIAMATASGVGEEIVFRGVVFRLLESRLGTTIALGVSAGAFGLLHAGNPGATWASTLAIALEAGVLLGLAYVLTRSLWFPIGLHLAWNLTEGGIFGAAVSGGQNVGLISASLSGPPLITGGAFGPEASIAAVAVSLCASVALALAAVRAGEWRAVRMRGPVISPKE